MDRSQEDEQLIGRLAVGDSTALDALYSRYAGVVFALILRIVADRQVAEEVLQEVFLRVWQRAGTYQGARGRVMSWLLGIAHNLAIDEVRRRRRRPQSVGERERAAADSELDLRPSPDADPHEEAWAGLRRARVEAALRTLPPPQRAVLVLAYFDGYTQSEIAARLGEPLGTVKTRMRLGLRKLRETAREQGLEIEVE